MDDRIYHMDDGWMRILQYTTRKELTTLEYGHRDSRQESQLRRFEEVSRQIVDATSAESTYRVGYTTFRVRSSFTGRYTLYDVAHAISARKLDMARAEQ